MSRPAKRRHIFKRINTHYRLVFIDDTSLQEVASFRLTMRKLYILFSSIFVFVIVVTVCILLLTPLKYYIPGYAGGSERREVIQLKRTVDSLSDLTAAQEEFQNNLKNVIAGDVKVKRDTTLLDMKKVNQEAMKNLVPMNEEIKKGALQPVKK
eukprot:TRINITY_DN55921_c0_g1_i1.p1 TRINITY_DN55921_c0_g1~~TRINITY_DN55921_c0_g1_i1.p1  ORF type:complete len:153 (-),score=22.18 TRINITY_DN55921_c0_g1_i1:261-719(-)